MKAIVVYYSLEGSTKYVAEQIAKNMQADLLRLETTKDYPTEGASKYIWGGKSVMFGETPRLKQYEFKKEEYDVVIIGSPTWAGSYTPPVKTFLKENDLSGKNVALYICNGGGDSSKCFKKLKDKLTNANILSELTLVNPAISKSEADTARVVDFCNTINSKMK